ncbi:MAG: GGDEF domain-containing protein [Ilumatobacteraceae bacterium]
MPKGGDVGTPPADIDDLIHRVRVAFTSGRLPEAVAMLDDADRLTLDDQDRLRFARVRAVTLSRSGRSREALAAIDGVATAWMERGDPHSAVSVSSMEAYIHNTLGQLDEALDAGAWTLVVLRELDGPASERMAPAPDRGPLGRPHLLLAATRNTLGLMFLDLEAVDLAIAEFTRVLELTGDDDPVLDGIARGNLASAYLRKALRRRTSDGRIEGADDELASAERLAREMLASDAPPRRLIEAVSVLVAVLLYTERVDEAAVLLCEHREHEHLVDDPRAMVDWNLLWARSHRGAGEFDEALERVQRSIELADQSGDRIAVSLARRERSRVREATGDLRGALDDLRGADDDSRELRSGRFEALVEQLIRRAGLEASRRRLEREAEHFGAERNRLLLASETDPLTGVGNRRRLATAIASMASAPDRPVSVVMVDIDEFKSFNDAFGHAFGDAVLVGLSAALASLARDDDILCRPGGDEFFLILPGVGPTDARAVAERIRQRVGRLRWGDDGTPRLVEAAADIDADHVAPRLFDVSDAGDAGGDGDDGVGVSISVGVASGTTADVEQLLQVADDGLLLAKRSGRDRIGVAERSARDERQAG